MIERRASMEHALLRARPLCHWIGLARISCALVVALGSIGALGAGISDCYRIKEGDVRHYCMALARRDTGGCYQIKDDDRRNFCLALVKGQRSHCYAIRGQDARHLCLAQVSY